MGIDNVAIKTFNSTGAQSVCRANEADSSKLIESQFLTKCTTEYINGSGMSVLNAASSDTGRLTDTFHLPSDVDAISDMIYTGAQILNITEITIKVGQLTIQKIYQHDILLRDATEAHTTPVFLDGTCMSDTNRTFSIPFTGRAKNVRNSFLQAGAITNSVTVTVKYGSSGANTGMASICVFSHQMTNTEKNFIANNIINRVVHTSMGFPSSSTIPTSGTLTVDLSGININVSHILIASASTSAISSFELVLGNDRTGSIPSECSKIEVNAALFSLYSNSYKAASAPGFDANPAKNYIIKTADSAFSTAGIPFSRLSNKQLIIKGAATNKVFITVCGTQIQTTVGGTTTFSA